MLSSVVVLPSPAMLVVAGIHLCLLQLKVRNEERFLHERFGKTYERYCLRVGRFFPRVFAGRQPCDQAETGAANGLAPLSSSQGGSDGLWRPLNEFQRGMLMWEEALPYNAAHALWIDRPADEDRLRLTIERTYRRLGMGDLTIDRRSGFMRWNESDSLPV